MLARCMKVPACPKSAILGRALDPLPEPRSIVRASVPDHPTCVAFPAVGSREGGGQRQEGRTLRNRTSDCQAGAESDRAALKVQHDGTLRRSTHHAGTSLAMALGRIDWGRHAEAQGSSAGSRS